VKIYLIILLIISSLIFAFTACNPVQPTTIPASPTALAKVDVCYSAIAGPQIVTWYAFEKGLFEKYGLDVNLVPFTTGTQATTAMIAGDVDICQIAGPSVASAIVAGEDMQMVGGFFNTFPYTLFVTPEIQSADDLRGKSVGIGKPGGVPDVAIRAALKYLGLEPDKDVTILPIGTQAENIAAMQAGQIVGAVLAPPETSEALELGYHGMLDIASLGIPYQHTGVATTRRYIEANRQNVVNFMKAVTEAIALMKEDPQGFNTVMAKYMLLDETEDKASLDDSYPFLMNQINKIPYPTIPGMKSILEYLVNETPEAANVKPEDTVDLTIVQELESSGFIDSLYK